MNRKIIIVFICVFLLCGCTSNVSEKDNNGLFKDGSIKVSEIHDSDIKEYEFLEDDDPAFIEISFEDACKFFRNQWSGIIYFGHVGCPWCERAVPVLNEVAKKANILVYYIDASKDVGKNDNESDKLFEEMKRYISDSYREDENGELTFFVPNVIGVKNGKLVDYKSGLPDSYDINEKNQMSDAERNELYKKYAEIFQKVYGK